MQFTVFTKPWKTPIPELARFVRDLGFDGVELPVRPGYPVEPERVGAGLPEAARQFADAGVKIGSIAGPTDAPTIAACAEAGVPIIRICAGIEKGELYREGEARLQRMFDGLLPALERHGVRIGIQNHCGRSVPNAMSVLHLIERYNPRQIAAVWDAGHEALVGTEPEFALDTVWSHLCLVNLKNAYWQRATGPEAEDVTWRSYWTTGRQGISSWPRVAAELKRRGYQGDICLCAEYSDHDSVERLTAQDLAYAKSLFA